MPRLSHPHHHAPEIDRLDLWTVLLPKLLARIERGRAHEPMSCGPRLVSGDCPAEPYESRRSVK
ncbi:MAG: hypothetical protein QOJ89_1190 [bacterium]|jgi:hypothetical protein